MDHYISPLFGFFVCTGSFCVFIVPPQFTVLWFSSDSFSFGSHRHSTPVHWFLVHHVYRSHSFTGRFPSCLFLSHARFSFRFVCVSFVSSGFSFSFSFFVPFVRFHCFSTQFVLIFVSDRFRFRFRSGFLLWFSLIRFTLRHVAFKFVFFHRFLVFSLHGFSFSRFISAFSTFSGSFWVPPHTTGFHFRIVFSNLSRSRFHRCVTFLIVFSQCVFSFVSFSSVRFLHFVLVSSLLPFSRFLLFPLCHHVLWFFRFLRFHQWLIFFAFSAVRFFFGSFQNACFHSHGFLFSHYFLFLVFAHLSFCTVLRSPVFSFGFTFHVPLVPFSAFSLVCTLLLFCALTFRIVSPHVRFWFGSQFSMVSFVFPSLRFFYCTFPVLDFTWFAFCSSFTVAPFYRSCSFLRLRTLLVLSLVSFYFFTFAFSLFVFVHFVISSRFSLSFSWFSRLSFLFSFSSIRFAPFCFILTVRYRFLFPSPPRFLCIFQFYLFRSVSFPFSHPSSLPVLSVPRFRSFPGSFSHSALVRFPTPRGYLTPHPCFSLVLRSFGFRSPPADLAVLWFSSTFCVFVFLVLSFSSYFLVFSFRFGSFVRFSPALALSFTSFFFFFFLSLFALCSAVFISGSQFCVFCASLHRVFFFLLDLSLLHVNSILGFRFDRIRFTFSSLVFVFTLCNSHRFRFALDYFRFAFSLLCTWFFCSFCFRFTVFIILSSAFRFSFRSAFFFFRLSRFAFSRVLRFSSFLLRFVRFHPVLFSSFSSFSDRSTHFQHRFLGFAFSVYPARFDQRFSHCWITQSSDISSGFLFLVYSLRFPLWLDLVRSQFCFPYSVFMMVLFSPSLFHVTDLVFCVLRRPHHRFNRLRLRSFRFRRSLSISRFVFISVSESPFALHFDLVFVHAPSCTFCFSIIYSHPVPIRGFLFGCFRSLLSRDRFLHWITFSFSPHCGFTLVHFDWSLILRLFSSFGSPLVLISRFSFVFFCVFVLSSFCIFSCVSFVFTVFWIVLGFLWIFVLVVRLSRFRWFSCSFSSPFLTVGHSLRSFHLYPFRLISFLFVSGFQIFLVVHSHLLLLRCCTFTFGCCCYICTPLFYVVCCVLDLRSHTHVAILRLHTVTYVG